MPVSKAGTYLASRLRESRCLGTSAGFLCEDTAPCPLHRRWFGAAELPGAETRAQAGATVVALLRSMQAHRKTTDQRQCGQSSPMSQGSGL